MYFLCIRRFQSKIDVIELGGSDTLCGKGYELSLFLFSDVLEISKKKSSAKGLGLRSPSTMSLRNIGAGGAGLHQSDGKPDRDTGSKSFKHVTLMNLTAIKRVVDITADVDTTTDPDTNIFAMVCRNNQELKERMFVFQLTSEADSEDTKQKFLKLLCRNIASTMCRPDPDTYLRRMRAEDLGLDPSEFYGSNFSTTYRTLQKKVSNTLQVPTCLRKSTF